MYLISIYFDEKTEQLMQSFINQVAKITGNTFMIDGNIPPHITLLGIQGEDEEEIIRLLDANIDSIESEDIYFASIGEFKRQTIYVQPVLSEYLHKLSQKVYDIYKDKEGIKYNQFYKPFSWVPHMSIGKHLDECQMIEAFKYLVMNFVPMEARVTKIGIAKTNPHRDIKIYEIKRNEQ